MQCGELENYENSLFQTQAISYFIDRDHIHFIYFIKEFYGELAGNGKAIPHPILQCENLIFVL